MKLKLEKLKQFDAYYKPIEDYHERTFIGGTDSPLEDSVNAVTSGLGGYQYGASLHLAVGYHKSLSILSCRRAVHTNSLTIQRRNFVSILCWLTILLLTSLRCYEFFSVVNVTQSIYVDSSRSPKLWINLDIVIPRISCDYVALDAMDSSGAQHLQIDHNVYKRRLDANGKPIADPQKDVIGSSPPQTEAPPSSDNKAVAVCGSCYGAEDSNNQEKFNITCCNTCEEVKDAYRKRRWQVVETNFDQCKSSATAQQIKRAFEEGCQIYGYMEVNRVSGSFHIAPGQSFTLNHVHVHDVQPFSSSQFNTSHIIRHLSFGKNKITDSWLNSTELPVNPLDGTASIATQGSTMFQYYIKIVPTLLVSNQGRFHTNQFSVTKHEKVVSPSSGESGMPGVFFSYELSAMMVKIVTKSVPLTHLITDLCSIIGGVWIFAMFIDSVFYRSAKLLNKIELGKAS